MKAAGVLYIFLLLLEGTLAWILSGEGFLLIAVSTGLLVYASLQHLARPVAEGTRLLTAALLVVVGPMHYQHSLTPLLLCFIAIPHFLAATQAWAEQRQDAAAHGHPRMRTMVFTIAFYTSMGLVFLLARGMEPDLPRLATSILAVLVLLVALSGWEASRIPRLRPAVSPSSPGMQRWLLPAALLVLTGLIFAGPLPFAANLLCRLSPHWRMDPVEFKNKPPKPPPTIPTARVEGDATRPGVDESSVTGEHRLPPRSNLQSSDAPRFYLKLEPSTGTTALLAQGPVYLRSHTLNRFSDNKWSPEVSGGVWIGDADDGVADGRIVLQPPAAVPLIAHEVFARGADGYTLPALPGLSAIHLPRVYSVPGDVLQSPATGDIRYRVESAPVLYQMLPDQGLLETGTSGDRIHLQPADGETGFQMQRLADSVFGATTLLADRIAALRSFLAEHYSYSTVMSNPHQLGALENFLFDERRGHCDFYATSAALLLRHAGIPTRIAYGFASPESDPATGLVVVRDRHAHAWTEILLKDYGWTLCDFTPSERIGQPSPAAPPPPPPTAPDLASFVDAAKETPLRAGSPSQPDLPFPARLLAWFRQQPWLDSALHHGPVVLLGIAVLWAAIRWLRRPPEDPEAAAAKARASLDQQPGYFREFLRISAAAGHPKPDGRTPLEHFHALQEAGLPVPPLRPLMAYHCATRYENAARDPHREQAFTADLETFALASLASSALTADN